MIRDLGPHFKRKKVIFSLISAITLIVVVYFANNAPLFTGEAMNQYALYQYVCKHLGIHKQVSYGNTAFYNVGYDKVLIPAIEGDRTDSLPDDTLGVNTITDRKKLTQFLRVLQETNSYKYIILDIIFEKRDINDYDDTLFNQIKAMNRIVVADHPKVESACPELEGMGKSGLVSYYTTNLSTNFARYEYTENDKRSIPMVVYDSLSQDSRKSGISLKRYGWGRFSVYFYGCKLCQNSNFLTFDDFNKYELSEIRVDSQIIRGKVYENLGKLLENPEIMEDVKTYTNDKVVIIGDFIHDMHDTYMGEVPGPLILSRALQTLIEGKNTVSLSHTLGWLVIFFFISLAVLRDKPLSKSLPIIRAVPWKPFHFVCSLMSFSVVLFVCSFLEYAYFDQVYSLLIPISFFTLMKLYVQYKTINSQRV